MALSINEPQIEKRLNDLGGCFPVRTSKRALSIAILRRAAKLNADEMYRWLGESEPARTNAEPEPSAA